MAHFTCTIVAIISPGLPLTCDMMCEGHSGQHTRGSARRGGRPRSSAQGFHPGQREQTCHMQYVGNITSDHWH
eukprot:4716568-Amphidinium_carterae.1